MKNRWNVWGGVGFKGKECYCFAVVKHTGALFLSMVLSLFSPFCSLSFSLLSHTCSSVRSSSLKDTIQRHSFACITALDKRGQLFRDRGTSEAETEEGGGGVGAERMKGKERGG